MPGRAHHAGDLRTLLDLGSIAGLDDGALLDLYEARADAALADRAFEALVRRHGALVLRVARGRLRDEADARDAFQATFWLLARRSRSIRHRNALAGWLFGVASRVAARAAVEAARRRARERRAALPVADSTRDPARRDPDLRPTIEAEIARLPPAYRAAVLLCDLEGLSYDEAARRLGCRVGTFKARLSRARARLRAQLTRRGLAPTGWQSLPLTVPTPLIQAACRIALATTPPAGASAVAFISITTLARGGSTTMFLTSFPTWAAVGMLTLGATVGTVAVVVNSPHVEITQQQIGNSATDELPQKSSTPRSRLSGPALPTSTPSPAALPAFYHQAFLQALAAADTITSIPDRVEALLGIGRSQTRQGEYDGARLTFRRALAVAAAGKPEDRWTITHPVVRIAEAQILNGDNAEGHQSFRLAIAIIKALPAKTQNANFLNALIAQVRLEGRSASKELAAAYREYLQGVAPLYGEEFVLIERTQALAMGGSFAEALDAIRHSPSFRPEGRPELQSRSFVAIAEALVPTDPPDLIDSTLAEARRAVLDQGVLDQGMRMSKFNNLTCLMTAMAKLNRFDAAAELGGHFADLPPFGKRVEQSNLFNKSLCYSTLAEAENRAGQPDAAARSARKALDWIREITEPEMRAHPLSRALGELIVAGESEEALNVYESVPLDVLALDNILVSALAALEKQGKKAEARHWVESSRDRVQRWLDEAAAAVPRDEVKIASLIRYRQQYETKLETKPETRSLTLPEIEALPDAQRSAAFGVLALEWATQGRIVDALALIDRITDPTLRRESRIHLVSWLPKPSGPPTAQSPRSDAAR